jgi:hypothetical protein
MVAVVEVCVDGAVYSPLLVIEPALAVQFTAVLPVPVTLAVNCCVSPGARLVLDGVTLTVTWLPTLMLATALPLAVGSATLVAVMVAVVQVCDAGAVNSPFSEIVPTLVVQFTAVLPVPVTVATNCCVPPGATLALDGETLTLTWPSLRVAIAVPLADGSATLVAVMVAVVHVCDGGDVNSPLSEIVPTVVVQFTAVFAVPVTVATNCCVPPGATLALDGETLTLTWLLPSPTTIVKRWSP